MSNLYIFTGDDLRIYDNYALKAFVRAGGTVDGMYYVIDKWHYPKSIHARKFIYGVLKQNGIPCQIVDSFDQIKLGARPQVFMNRKVYRPQVDSGQLGYHPYRSAIKVAGGELHLFDDWSMLVEVPRTTPYMVFTPFYERAVKMFAGPLSGRLVEPTEKITPKTDELDCRRGAAIMAATARNYDHDVGSGVSAFLSRGVISGREAAKAGARSGEFIRELLWREFYYQIAIWRPETMRLGNYGKNLSTVARERVRRWKLGRTGIDYIDLAMQELRDYGTMPNRLRMLVAELLCGRRYYGLGWWIGEDHFEDYLEDYDFVLNRGNWLWCADSSRPWAKPDFRGFSLERQAKHRAVRIFMKL